jgi:hypothetical protein
VVYDELPRHTANYSVGIDDTNSVLGRNPEYKRAWPPVNTQYHKFDTN